MRGWEPLISDPGGRVPRARLQSPRPLRYLRGFQLALFPLESPPSSPINYVFLRKRMIDLYSREINVLKRLKCFIIILTQKRTRLVTDPFYVLHLKLLDNL